MRPEDPCDARVFTPEVNISNEFGRKLATLVVATDRLGKGNLSVCNFFRIILS